MNQPESDMGGPSHVWLLFSTFSSMEFPSLKILSELPVEVMSIRLTAHTRETEQRMQ